MHPAPARRGAALGAPACGAAVAADSECRRWARQAGGGRHVPVATPGLDPFRCGCVCVCFWGGGGAVPAGNAATFNCPPMAMMPPSAEQRWQLFAAVQGGRGRQS